MLRPREPLQQHRHQVTEEPSRTSVATGTFRRILGGGCRILVRKAPGFGSFYKGKV